MLLGRQNIRVSERITRKLLKFDFSRPVSEGRFAAAMNRGLNKVHNSLDSSLNMKKINSGSYITQCSKIIKKESHPLKGTVSRDSLITAIIVNWNGLKLLDDCFTSLARQTWRKLEFVLVDNGSTDGSRDQVIS